MDKKKQIFRNHTRHNTTIILFSAYIWVATAHFTLETFLGTLLAVASLWAINGMYSIGSLPLLVFGVVQRVPTLSKTQRLPTTIYTLDEVANVIVTRDGFKEHLKENLVGDVYFADKDTKNKGEALNRWLKQFGAKYRYVFIWDNDSDVQDKNYVDAISYFTNKDAWIQTTIHGKSGVFHKDVKTFFKYSSKENFISCGHNVVYKISAVQEAGGFPEQMGEDFILSSKLWNMGYTSYLAPTITYEDTPDNFVKFVKRELKWSGLEKNYIKQIPEVLKSKALSLQQKMSSTFSFLRAVITVVIIVLLGITITYDVTISYWFFIAFVFFALIPSSSIEMIVLSPALVVTTATGFTAGLFKNDKYFVTTHNITNSYKKETAFMFSVIALLMIGVTWNLLTNFALPNTIFDSFMLTSFGYFTVKYAYAKQSKLQKTEDWGAKGENRINNL